MMNICINTISQVYCDMHKKHGYSDWPWFESILGAWEKNYTVSSLVTVS